MRSTTPAATAAGAFSAVGVGAVAVAPAVLYAWAGRTRRPGGERATDTSLRPDTHFGRMFSASAVRRPGDAGGGGAAGAGQAGRHPRRAGRARPGRCADHRPVPVRQQPGQPDPHGRHDVHRPVPGPRHDLRRRPRGSGSRRPQTARTAARRRSTSTRSTAPARSASPQLYDPADRAKLRIESGGAFEDVPRTADGTAIIGDPRNDENLIIAGLQCAFILFHNRAVDQARAADGAWPAPSRRRAGSRPGTTSG